MKQADNFTERIEQINTHISFWSVLESDDFWEWERGSITLPEGVVLAETVVYRERQQHFLWLWFVYNGRRHIRHWEINFSRRFIITLAKRFVADIVGGNDDSL